MTQNTLRKKSTRLSDQQWQQIIADFDQSGLTQSRYCKQNKIPVSTFSKWRLKFSSQTQTKESQSSFAQVVPAQTLTSSVSSTIKVHFNDQYTLEWTESISPTYIGDLLKVLFHAV